LLFSFAISDALSKISGTFTAGYLDDITLSDTVQNLTGEIKKFQKEALKIGLDLNHAKCEIIGLTEFRSDWSSSGLHYLEPSMAATNLLGSPLYNDRFLPILNSHSASLSTMSIVDRALLGNANSSQHRLLTTDDNFRASQHFPVRFLMVPGIPTRPLGGLGS